MCAILVKSLLSFMNRPFRHHLHIHTPEAQETLGTGSTDTGPRLSLSGRLSFKRIIKMESEINFENDFLVYVSSGKFILTFPLRAS